jgi:hypothetical protein
MASNVIPIRCERPEAPTVPTRLIGDPARTGHVQAALEAAVWARLGDIGPTERWLREIRLGDGEAYVLIAPDLGCDGMDSAEIAFEVLRRLLPDTDIYVSAAPT